MLSISRLRTEYKRIPFPQIAKFIKVSAWIVKTVKTVKASKPYFVCIFTTRTKHTPSFTITNTAGQIGHNLPPGKNMSKQWILIHFYYSLENSPLLGQCYKNPMYYVQCCICATCFILPFQCPNSACPYNVEPNTCNMCNVALFFVFIAKL
jgi:hypothetical protein